MTRPPVLGARALGRATLARNLLLRRASMSPQAAVEHLVGVQAQEPQEPYVGLAARLEGFDPLAASGLLESRTLVRTLLMRRTMHLVTSGDCLALRPILAPVLLQRMRSVLRPRLAGVEEAELAAAGRPVFEESPRTLGDVGRAVHPRWPHTAPRDLGDALGSLLPLVQVPPRGLWRQSGAARNTTIRAWLGEELPADPPSADELVLRYLAAYGPAATADVRAWSGLSGLSAVMERLRPDLRVFMDERGRLLYDLPDASLPHPEEPAPPRFLPAFDNVVLGYDDRSRVIDDCHGGLSVTGARFLLVDGRVAGTWDARPDGDDTVLTISPLDDLARSDEVDAEAEMVLAMLSPDGRHGRVEWSSPTR